MTVRVFSSARITLDEGTLDTFRTNGFLTGAWTAVCVFKRSGSTGDGTQFMFSASSSGSLRFGLSYSTGSALQVTVGGNSRTFGASFTISNDTWYVFAVRKDAGTATPDAKLWNAGTGSVVADWTNGNDTLDDDANLWDELQIGNRVNDFPLNGKEGGLALYSSKLDNTTGNTLGTGLQEWLDASPVGMWPLTQASTATAVEDIVGTAEQTAITGTSVDTGDDPASFDLSLGGNPPVTLGQAVETNTATTLARSKSLALAQATETDTATALARSKALTAGQAAETDTAAVLSRSKSGTLGQASEADTAAALARSKALALGIAAETDTATTPTRSKSRAIGIASEADTASVLTIGNALVLGQAMETNTAGALARAKALAIGIATEANTATALVRSKVLAIGQAAEVDSATGFARSKSRALGLGSETDTAGTVGPPDDGIIHRPNTGTTSRPSSGIITRPYTGIITRP